MLQENLFHWIPAMESLFLQTIQDTTINQKVFEKIQDEVYLDLTENYFEF